MVIAREKTAKLAILNRSTMEKMPEQGSDSGMQHQGNWNISENSRSLETGWWTAEVFRRYLTHIRYLGSHLRISENSHQIVICYCKVPPGEKKTGQSNFKSAQL